MKKRQFSAPSILNRAGSVFPIIGIWRENRILLLSAVTLVAAVVILFIWLARRRRQDTFPELRPQAEAAADEMDMTQIESLPDSVVPRPAAPSPGLYGKIEVVVGNQPIGSYLVTDNPLPIGRDPAQSLVVIQEPIISKLHCQIFVRTGQVFVRDLQSTNGVYLNNEKVDERELLDNDIVFLGKKGTVKIIYHR